MVDKIDLSLDEIIKSTKSMKVGRRGASTGGRRGRGAGGNFRGRGANTSVRRQSGGSGGGSGAGGVQKGRNRGGGIARPRRADVNGAWKHDMYEGVKRRSGGGLVSSGGGSANLMVSNLDYGVSESDIRELFGEFGPLRSASLHFDRSGRSLGTADVVFERRGDAIKAQTQYNGVPLDGRPMKIQLAVSELPMAKARVGGGSGAASGAAKGFSPRKSITPRKPMRGGGGGRGGLGARRGGAAGGRGGKRTPKATPTAAELDAELDAYVKDTK